MKVRFSQRFATAFLNTPPPDHRMPIASHSLRRVAQLLILTVAGMAASIASAAVTTNQIKVPPPPIGWASWNAFASSINFDTVKKQVDAYVAPGGLKDAGYVYFNLDDGWWQGLRDASGNIVVNTTEWPGGMKAVADYIHSKGVKAGIYTDAGVSGCGYFNTTRPSSAGFTAGIRGHELQDAKQFQVWGFDFVKVDWCGGSGIGYQNTVLDPVEAYGTISKAIADATAITGHPMTLSICEWGRQEPWNWAPGMAPMWRSSDDVVLWQKPGGTVTLDQMTLKPSLAKALVNFDKGLHPSAHHTGFYNDLDMLMVGNGVARGAGSVDLTDAESRTHINLWLIGGSPFMAGNDLTKMNAATKAILTNSEVIAINQDARGLQGVKVSEDIMGLQVYSRVLSGNGRRAVVLLNRTGVSATMTVRWTDIGLTADPASVRDIWANVNGGSFSTSYAATVPANGSVLLSVVGTESATATYEAESSNNVLTGIAARAPCTGCSGAQRVGDLDKDATLAYKKVNANDPGVKLVNIAYVNGDNAARRATLQVNGQQSTVVSFPSTGSWTTPGTVSLMLSLAKGANTLTFGTTSGWAPDMDAITVQNISGTNGGNLFNTLSGRCLDIPNNRTDEGVQAQLSDCNGGQNQTMVRTVRSELQMNGNRCLEVHGGTANNGAKVGLWSCNGGTNQQWAFNANGTITSQGFCLDVTTLGTVNGTPLQVWTCNAGSATQQWIFNK